MKIFFNTIQFPKALEECSVNDEMMKLNKDIKYIPSNFNKVIIGDNEADKEDWQTVCDNWDVFIGYFIDTIQENIHEDDENVYMDMTCMDLFEMEFIISGVN